MSAPAPPPAAGGAAAANANANANGQTDWKWTIGRAVLMYVGIQYVMGPNGLFAGKRAAPPASAPAPAPAPAAVSPDEALTTTNPISADSAVPAAMRGVKPTIPLWAQNQLLDFYVFVSSAPAPSVSDLATQQSDLVPLGGLDLAPEIPYSAFADLLRTPVTGQQPRIAYVSAEQEQGEGVKPLAAVKWSDVVLGDFDMSRDADLLLTLDDQVRLHNGSIWADLVVAPKGYAPDAPPRSPGSPAVFRTRKLLTRLYPFKKKRAEKNLFSGKSESEDSAAAAEEEEQSKTDDATMVGYWHRNLTLALVQDDEPVLPLDKIPPPILQHVHLAHSHEGTKLLSGQGRHNLRYPVLFANDFWLLREHMSPINATVVELPLHVHLYHQSWFKFQMIASMTEAFERQAGGVTGGELDMFKTMLLETNPWFLALTIAVSLLHSLFEFLAFSSDVRHWRNKDDLAGVSVGSILTNVVVQLIITLYLLDNNEDTSWMILAGQAVGVLIEAWKLTKAVSVGIEPAPAGSWLPYRLRVSDKHVLSDEERRTQEYDRLAFKYVGAVALPVLIGYTVYSALYNTHRGWWSFIISTATSFVYAFGFVSLVPQLIVNYKLKSTAGMNTKTFVYKILGTFVDDLFAFCIKMPTLHRLACFRDDIVFFIFLYQRWIYGVDPTRRNEFGQVQEDAKKNEDQPAPDSADDAAVAQSSARDEKETPDLRKRTNAK